MVSRTSNDDDCSAESLQEAWKFTGATLLVVTIAPDRRPALLRKARFWLALFMLGLVLSGVTAFPLETEVAWLTRLLRHFNFVPVGLMTWLERVQAALADENARYPFLAYGTDWLAFAHLVLAAVFIGPWRDPVRNRWVLRFGLIACMGVLPLALIAGPLRGIPLYWRLIDCSFGVFGALILWPALSASSELERDAYASATGA